MGLFSNPKCPYCGEVVTATGYSFPYPAYRCENCIERNKQRERIKELEKEIEKLKTPKQ